MIHDLLFTSYCKNHGVSEAEILNEAILIYFQDHGELRPDKLTSELVDASKKHFLNKLQTFKMDLMNPGCLPRGKPTRSGTIIK